MTKRILIRVDGSKKIGLGHVYNMLTILHYLKNEEIIIVMNEESNLGSSKFKEQMYKILKKLMLSKKRIKEFHDNGFIIVRKFLKKRDIKNIFAQMDDVLSTILKYNKIKYK